MTQLVVVTSTVHRIWEGRVYAYQPYVREMNLWFTHYDRVRVCAPVLTEAPESNFVPYDKPDLELVPLPVMGGHTIWNKLAGLARVPFIWSKLWRASRSADQVHIRNPGNMGLLMLLLCPLLPQYKVAKYANQWPDYEGEPWSQRLQKGLLANPKFFRNGVVLVYGGAGRPAPHVRPFFTASYTANELAAVRERALAKSLDPSKTVQLAFLGRMVPYKGGTLAIETVAILKQAGITPHLHVAGDGRDLPAMRLRAAELNVEPMVTFHGNLNQAGVEEILLRAHFVLQLSSTEGWPKVITEGMAMGAVPIATGVSCVPWMLGDGERGTVIARDAAAAAAAVLNYCSDPARYRRTAVAAEAWAARYTLESFHEEIRALTTTATPG